MADIPKFRGHYVTNEAFTDTSAFPADLNDGDVVVGVWQKQDNTERKSKVFTYVIVNGVGAWETDESDPVEIYSTSPDFTPLESRLLNVYEPYGMGLHSILYVYVEVSSIPNWLSGRAGNCDVPASKMEFHDTFNGAKVNLEDLPDSIGILPVYVRSGDQLVGVGSATFIGSWRVMWYKMAAVQGAPPAIVTDMETILLNGELIMRGNTTGYTLTVWDKDEAPDDITGDYTPPLTTYSLAAYPNLDWKYLILADQNGDTVYKMTNYLGPEFSALQTQVGNYLSHVESVMLDHIGYINERVRKNIAASLVKSIELDASTGALKINCPSVALADGASVTPTPITLPAVSIDGDGCEGVMTPEMLTALQKATSDIIALQSTGGKWIGENFNTKSELDAFIIDPEDISPMDYSYVLLDESLVPAITGALVATFNTHADLLAYIITTEVVGDYAVVLLDETQTPSRKTMYVIKEDAYENLVFVYTPTVRALYVVVEEGEDLVFYFSREDSVAAPEIGTVTTPGLVKSSLAQGQGKISINLNTGEMTFNDYTNMMLTMYSLTTRVAELGSQVKALQNGKESTYTSPAATPLHGLSLTEALAYINSVITGATAATINHAE